MGSALEPTPYKPQPIWTAWKLGVAKLLVLLDAATSTVPTGTLRLQIGRLSPFSLSGTMVVTRALMKGARWTAARGATLQGALRCRWNNRKYRFPHAKKIPRKLFEIRARALS
jgi:hypothetical protein